MYDLLSFKRLQAGANLHIKDKNSSKGKVAWTGETIAYKYETLFSEICISVQI